MLQVGNFAGKGTVNLQHFVNSEIIPEVKFLAFSLQWSPKNNVKSKRKEMQVSADLC